MQKRTHLLFAFLLFLLLNKILNYPAYLSVFALVGAMIPDIDLHFKHRTWAHSVWFLLFLLAAGFALGWINFQVAVMFSIGFVSHIISDSITHRGLMPFWPIGPKIKGIVRVGGLSEWIVAAGILAGIFAVFGLIRI